MGTIMPYPGTERLIMSGNTRTTRSSNTKSRTSLAPAV